MPETFKSGKPKPRLAFVITEDWFFVSHFLHLAQAAADAGFQPVVIARVDRHRAAIEAAGAQVVDFAPGRVGNGLVPLLCNARSLAVLLRDLGPEVVHCISLRSIMLGCLAARLAGVPATVIAVTGMGHLAVRTDPVGRALRSTLCLTIRRILAPRQSHFVFENWDDARRFGLRRGDPQATVVGGAGVEVGAFPVLPMPARPPLRLALIARMIVSKGVDTAVEAVRIARERGADVTLSVFGEPDPYNPRSFTAEQLTAWNAMEGIEWRGRTSDVAQVWAAHHACIMPSRGGEGLPRTILEAAACGRPILTSNVPGCRDFVRDGIEGFLAPPADPDAFARLIVQLNDSRAATMGYAARKRVQSGYTAEHVSSDMAKVWKGFISDM